MAICNFTGMLAIFNKELDLYMSPMADGPVQFTGDVASDLKIDKITKFGRSFSVVRVPYSFKLLIQELATLNIQMRVITEDNIDQISSMSFSNMEIPGMTSIKKPVSVTDKKEEKTLLENITEGITESITRGITEGIPEGIPEGIA